MKTLKEAVVLRKSALLQLVESPLRAVLPGLEAVYPEADALDGILQGCLADIPHCALLYVTDVEGRQLSSGVSSFGLDRAQRGRDLSRRPYFAGPLPLQGVVMSGAYLSQVSFLPCITAVAAIPGANTPRGFLLADFHVRDLPTEVPHGAPLARWTQFKGDPAIRETLFLQHRVPSPMDERIDEVLAIVTALVRDHGVFHLMLHFSSSRATVWHVDDPFCYWLHGVDEILSPDVCLAYPRRAYPDRAMVGPEAVPAVLARMRDLRFADENIYLRSASLNIMNGLVGLTFSCDGSHYMSADEFTAQGLGFWLGNVQDGSRP